MQTIGKSHQGRNLWCLTITDFAKGNADRKPAMYIQGNIHGNEIQGGEFALYTAWYLTESFADVRYIQDLLADKVFYIVPTINPDSRDYFIHKSATEGGPRGYLGLNDAGFNDLDGDGNITMMRIKNPRGIYKIDPKDPRNMVSLDQKDIVLVDGVERAKVPDAGNYDLLREGGIWEVNGAGDENKPLGLKPEHDPNRNWGFGREEGKPPTWQSFTYPETKAARDFFLAHPNIAAAESLHNYGCDLYPPTEKTRKEDPSDAEDDKRILSELGKYGEKVLPEYRYDDGGNRPGGFGREIDWMFATRGAYSFLIELSCDRMFFNKQDRVEADINDEYTFNDDLLFGDGFVPWHEATDPHFGKVEVGGWKKNFSRLDAGFLMEADAHRNMAFSLYLGYQTPKLQVRNIVVKDLGNGLQEVTMLIANTRLMPTHSGPNLKHKISRPDYVTLGTVGKVLTAIQVETGQTPDAKVIKEQKDNPKRFEVSNIKGNSAVAIRWVVKGTGPYTVTVDSVKGGVASASTNTYN
jgi:hypothetical protein